MLPSNFELLVSRHPELREPVHAVQHWISEHPDWDFLDPRVLSHDIKGIDAVELALVLQLLVHYGILRTVYAVQMPSGSLASEHFQTPDQIPDRLPDSFNEYFDTDEAPVVPILTSAK